MHAENVIPFRPAPRFDDGPPDTLLALLEAAEGLPDETVSRLIDRHFPGALDADLEPMVRLAVRIPTDVPTARLLRAVMEVES